jgi:hypothetical protein
MAYLLQTIPRTNDGVTALPVWMLEDLPLPVDSSLKFTAPFVGPLDPRSDPSPRDPGHGDCCDCRGFHLGAHCEGHMENASSLTPEPGCDF